MKKTAVLLLNLGGPDSLKAVRPFLYNIFKDPSILPLPPVLRHFLAFLISFFRASSAKMVYGFLGGASPLLANTKKQAEALQKELGENFHVFIGMRYWHPRIKSIISAIKHFNPDHIVVLPLYPQFSTTTTESALAEWQNEISLYFNSIPISAIRSYPTLPGFIAPFSQSLKKTLGSLPSTARERVLFSAHGLPQYVVDRGDPYVREVNASIAAILKEVGFSSLDWRLCYQSRVGPVRWLEPDLNTEIKAAAQDNRHIVVVPISFVSEHSETLYELDHVYQALALQEGAQSYTRIPTPGIHPDFIAGLAELVRQALLSTRISLVQKVS